MSEIFLFGFLDYCGHLQLHSFTDIEIEHSYWALTCKSQDGNISTRNITKTFASVITRNGCT